MTFFYNQLVYPLDQKSLHSHVPGAYYLLAKKWYNDWLIFEIVSVA